jgi:hypothetical protein
MEVLSVDRKIHEWSDEDLQTMALWGNDRAHAYILLPNHPTSVLMERYWNAKGLAKGKPDMPKNARRKMIERKYVDKYWIPRTDTWDVEMHAKYPLAPDELAVLDYLAARKKTIADIPPTVPTVPANVRRREEKREVGDRRWSSEIVCNGRRVVMVGDRGSVSGRSSRSEKVINDGRMKGVQDPTELYHYLSKRRASILGREVVEWGPVGEGAKRGEVSARRGATGVDGEMRPGPVVVEGEARREPVVVDGENEPLGIEVMKPFRSQGNEGSLAVDEKNQGPGSEAMKPLVPEKVASRGVSVGDLIDFMGDTSLGESGFDGGDLFEFDGFHGTGPDQGLLDLDPDLGLLDLADLRHMID